MAVIRDVMPAFALYQPTSIDGALALLRQHRDTWLLAGGLDSFDWFKDRLRKPGAVIDLSGIEELRGIKSWNGGLAIGAMTTLTEVVRSPEVRQRFAILLTGAEAAASPQIRNQGTIGGNVSQDTRCCYYRSGWTCYRAGGNICYADTPTALNREHAVLEMDRCVAVNPSDTAPALIALGAQMVIRSAEGERIVNAEDYFVGPATNITRMTVLRPTDLLTAIRIPGDFAEAQFFFEKVRDRQVWDFALVSVASAMTIVNGRIDRIRMAANGVAARPLRLTAVEEALKGRARDEDAAELAGSLAIRGARTLQHNAYKVQLLKNLVKRAVRGQETNKWTSSHPA